MIRSFCVLVALLATCVAWAAPAPEPSLPGWGKPIDPDKDCKFRRGKDSLTIEMPGIVHEYNLHRNLLNAPRLLREVEGDFELEVRVRIDCRPSIQSSDKDLPSYVSAGLLVIPPENYPIAFSRSEYRVRGGGDKAEDCTAMLEQDRPRGGMNGVATNKDLNWPFKEKLDSIYLRLDRQGELLGMFISPDRKTWKVIGGGGKRGLPSKLKVGLVACTTSTRPSKVVFDQLTFTQGKKREPWEFGSGWSKPVDPDKDCKIKHDKDTLTIEMPGSDHDYDPIRKCFNAPRLLSDLEGEFDVQVRVRIDSAPSAQSTVGGQPPTVSAGFLLIFPDKDYSICTRLEFTVGQAGNRPAAAGAGRKAPAPPGKEVAGYAVVKTWVGELQGKFPSRESDHEKPRQNHNDIHDRRFPNWPLAENAEYAYLRLDHRAGGWSSFFISADGKKWTRLDYMPSLPEKGKLALAAFSTSTEPSTVRFDQLKLWRYKKKSK